MFTRGIYGKLMSSAAALAIVLLCGSAAFAQAVGDAAPVPEKQGLLGTYYSYPVNSATPPGSPPTSPVTAHQAGTVLLGEQLDPSINIDYVANKPALNAGSSDWFMIEYTGRLVINTTEAYTFFVATDDGERTWFVDTTKAAPDMDHWVQRGVIEDTSAAINLTTGTTPNVRIEFEQGNGGASIAFRWQTATIAKAIVPTANLRPPLGPAAPTLNATSPIAPPPPQVNLTWNATAGATGYIISRQTVSGAPAVPMQVIAIINSGATVAYTDNAVAYNVNYNYIIQATSHNMICIGAASNTANVTPILPAVTVLPNTGLQTNENGATAVATITFNQALMTGQSVTFNVVCNLPTEALVSSSGQGPAGTINFTVNGPVAVGATIPLTMTGVDDPVVDPAHAYTVTVTTSGQFGAVTIPTLQCVNNDNDTPGITFSRTSGLLTFESGGAATFTVVLNTQPTGAVNIATLTSSDPTEGTVSPTSLQFTTTGGQAYSAATGIGGWNVAHTVTVTGVDDTILDFTIPYQINVANCTSTDPNYNFANPAIGCANIDNEVPPALPEVWGSGCGLLGFEYLLPLVFAAALRRRLARS